jgi:hypothetical protein
VNTSVLSSYYTQNATNTWFTSYYTKTVAGDLLNTIRTHLNHTNIDLTATISNLGSKSDKSTSYTMTQVNNLLNTKLTTSTGAVFTSFQNNYGTDVAMFL